MSVVCNPEGKRQLGFTMIELLIAMAILAIGMGAMLTVFAAAVQGNGRAKMDTAGTMLGQTVMDRIAAQPASTNGVVTVAPLTITDCNPAGATNWTIATAPGGANLDATGSLIDWTQAYGTIPPNYAMQFVACGNNGRQITYDIRWHVTTISANARLIIVSARPLAADNAGGNAAANIFATPITLRTIGGL